MSIVDLPAAQTTHTVTHGLWEPLRTGFRAAGTPMQQLIHPSMCAQCTAQWQPKLGDAAESHQVDLFLRELDGDMPTHPVRVAVESAAASKHMRATSSASPKSVQLRLRVSRASILSSPSVHDAVHTWRRRR